MKINFLGTGTSMGVPVICCHCAVCTSDNPKNSRLRTSIMVKMEGNTFVIDTGPDFRQQMLRAKVEDIDAILYTHEHTDHIVGMDDVRAYNFFRKKDVQLYATEQVQTNIKRVFHYVFAKDPYPGIPKIDLHTITNEPFVINGVSIQPIQVLHHQLPVFGFRFGDFTYITDANYISPEEKEKIKGTKVLVLNALRHEAHISHFTLEEALELITELQPERTYLTHISHQLGLHETIQQDLPKNVFLAYDGLELNL